MLECIDVSTSHLLYFLLYRHEPKRSLKPDNLPRSYSLRAKPGLWLGVCGDATPACPSSYQNAVNPSI